MIDNSNIVDYIERANDARPYCGCGRTTHPVYRDGTVWLECASLSQPHEGRLARLFAAATSPTHVHERLIEVPAA